MSSHSIAAGSPTLSRHHTWVWTAAQYAGVLVAGTLVVLALTNAQPWSASLPQTIALGSAQAGSTVTAQVGDTLELRLPGNPTTGYTWSVAGVDPAVLQVQGAPEFQAESTALGASGVFLFRFQIASVGRTPLTLIYSRPFEPDTPPQQTYEVTVNGAPMQESPH